VAIDNSEAQIQNGRQKILKPTMIVQTPKASNNGDKVATFPPQGSRVALLSVKFDIDENDVDANVDKSSTEMKETSKEISAETKETPVEEKSEIGQSPKICSDSKSKEHSDRNESKDCSSVKIPTVLGEVRFCNGKGINGGGNSLESYDRRSDELMNDLDDVIDHVTTISVDVHMIDTLRGPVKVTSWSNNFLDNEFL
jgi:hypothetical protein